MFLPAIAPPTQPMDNRQPGDITLFGAQGGGTDDTDAVNAARLSGNTVYIPFETIVSTSMNFLTDVEFAPGATLRPSAGTTLRFYENIITGIRQKIFDLQDGGAIGPGGAMEEVPVHWFGFSAVQDTATATANANAIAAAYEMDRPLLILPNPINKLTGWCVLGGIINPDKIGVPLSGPEGSYVRLNHWADVGVGDGITDYLVNCRVGRLTHSWLEIVGDAGPVETNAPPFYYKTNTANAIQEMHINNVIFDNCWGAIWDSFTGVQDNKHKRWFWENLEVRNARGPVFKIGDGNGTIQLTDIVAGRGQDAGVYHPEWDHPILQVLENAGGNCTRCNFIGTSEDGVAYAAQHGITLTNTANWTMESVFTDHIGGRGRWIVNCGLIRDDQAHSGYCGLEPYYIQTSKDVYILNGWIRGIPTSVGGTANINGVRVDALSSNIHVNDNRFEDVAGDGLRTGSPLTFANGNNFANVEGDAMQFDATASGGGDKNTIDVTGGDPTVDGLAIRVIAGAVVKFEDTYTHDGVAASGQHQIIAEHTAGNLAA